MVVALVATVLVVTVVATYIALLPVCHVKLLLCFLHSTVTVLQLRCNLPDKQIYFAQGTPLPM